MTLNRNEWALLKGPSTVPGNEPATCAPSGRGIMDHNNFTKHFTIIIIMNFCHEFTINLQRRLQHGIVPFVCNCCCNKKSAHFAILHHQLHNLCFTLSGNHIIYNILQKHYIDASWWSVVYQSWWQVLAYQLFLPSLVVHILWIQVKIKVKSKDKQICVLYGQHIHSFPLQNTHLLTLLARVRTWHLPLLPINNKLAINMSLHSAFASWEILFKVFGEPHCSSPEPLHESQGLLPVKYYCLPLLLSNTKPTCLM